MYKDKDKQREANREANKRYRERQEARESCVIPDGRDTLPVIPSCVTVIKADSHVDASDVSVVKAIHKNIPKRGKDIKSFEDY